jgi:uncharacterized membrane protein YfcA
MSNIRQRGLIAGMEVICGFLIALVIGMTGIGGGTLAAPALILLLRLPPAESVGTALVFAAIIKFNASLIYLYRRQVNYKVLGWLLVGGVPGAALGAIALHRMQLAQYSGVILAIVGVTVVVSALFNLLRHKLQPISSTYRPSLLSWLSLPLGAQVGFSSVGAGALGTVLLFGLTDLPPATVVGTDVAFGTVVAMVGGGLHVALNAWNGLVLLKMLAGGLFGVVAGSSLNGVLSPRVVRNAVLSWAALTGLLLIYKSLAQVI